MRNSSKCDAPLADAPTDNKINGEVVMSSSTQRILNFEDKKSNGKFVINIDATMTWKEAINHGMGCHKSKKKVMPQNLIDDESHITKLSESKKK